MHNYSRKQINQMNSMSMHKNFSIVISFDITSSCPRGLTKQLFSWTLVAKRESVVIVYPLYSNRSPESIWLAGAVVKSWEKPTPMVSNSSIPFGFVVSLRAGD